jgi:hypothetical protein
MGSGLLLFETASVSESAFPFRSRDGGPIGEQTRTRRNTLPYDKSEWRLEQIVDYIETGVWLALDAVAREPERWSVREPVPGPAQRDHLAGRPVGLRAAGRPA